jgi:hypothetical protein
VAETVEDDEDIRLAGGGHDKAGSSGTESEV